MPGPTGSQFRPLSWLRKRPAPAVPQYTRVGSRGSTATQSGDRPPKCLSTVQVEARRAIKRAARVTTTMPTLTQSPSVAKSAVSPAKSLVPPLPILPKGRRTTESSSRPLVEKHVKRHDPAIPHDDEIPPGVSRHFTRAPRYPWNHPCIAIFLRSGSHLISKVRMSRLDRAGDAIDRVAATDGALAGIVEHAIFGPELVDGHTPTRGIVFTENVAKISDQ